MLPRYILAWFILLIVAILNATLREMFFKNRLGELHPHQLSTL